jgi:eukaryotic-like serine/threonine-protein kinase
MMDPQRWKQVDNLLQSALDMLPDQWEAFLRNNCGGDRALEREVLSVLHAQRGAETFLAKPAIEFAAEEIARDLPEGSLEPSDSSLSGIVRTIGPYRLVQMLGSGGMGEVWRAEQAEPLRRTVAIKLIKAGMDTKVVVARFESERQTLALMDHPNIAKVFDAGTTPAGRPYFVMEYVPGVPIANYCDQHWLTINERLHVFLQVCDGVRHAHQKAIIHRDLKPSNILIQEIDGKPTPKIIDFGLAKAMGPRLTDATMYTEAGTMVGTPAYMSPEQADSQQRNVDTRTDVYSLGVILFELLVGALPFGGKELRDDGLEAMLRKIREQEAVRPSAKVSSLGNAASDSAIKRNEEPQSLIRHLRGDLDWITLKAIDRDRNRRYGSVAELAADIERHLSDQPVIAGPPSARYRAGKFVRRHRFGVAAGATVLILLLAFSITMTVQARRIARERDRAVRAEQIAKAVNDFLQDDLLAQAGARAQANTRSQPDPDLKVQTALSRAAARISGKFDSQPAVEAAIRRTIGLAYFDLNLSTEAQPQLERAVDLRKRVLGLDHPDTLTSMDELGVLYNLQGKYAAAEALLAQVLAARQRLLGSDHRDTLATMSDLGLAIAYGGDDARAAPIFAKVLETDRRILGEEDPATLSVLDNLAGAYKSLGRYSEAQALLEREVELNRRVLGPDHPDTTNSVQALAAVYRALGKYAAADPLFLATLESERRTLGEEHWETENARRNLAISYRAQGRYAEADPLFKRALASLQRGLGREHPLTLQVAYNLGESYRQQRRFTEAESILGEVLEARRRVLGRNNPYTAQALGALGEIKLEQRDYSEAERLVREALEIREQKTPDAWERYYSQSMLGASLWALGKYSEARPLLTSGYEGMLQRQSSIPAEYQPALKQAGAWVPPR